ncbi:hypothetical protein GCM10022291_13290 [Postechiella marina]|uniref:Uncharacterized protein n=1 Tax=Postechiella marina TaxID=943941 RepID=A0ABP8C6L0_9FLAO
MQEPQTNTQQKVSIGSLGSGKDFILQKNYNSAALPSYSKPIKVSVFIKPFTKQTYKSFLKASASQSEHVSINYTDSIKVKPQYIQFKIADKVELIEALNAKENLRVKTYLGHNSSTNIVTSISMAFNRANLDVIKQASGVFLIEYLSKQYALQLYKDGVKSEIIQFKEGVVFAYNTSNCCWQEDTRHRTNIVDIVDKYNRCPNKTFRSANKAKTENKLF